MKAKELYNVGIYLRLSRDDMTENAGIAFGRQESNSISSQRELVRSFVRSRKDMKIYDTYVDDGYSGANFDRPGFRKMMEDVLAGKVDCIVVKDLSRFGRDYIEAGRLIQKTFPAFNVRFIAVTDHYDSLTADYHETSLVLPVKNFVNDSYCRDISAKVRSHQRIKREKGEFIGAFAVYGYCKGERNKLVPDAYAARIVRAVFDWKLEGMSCGAIAARLRQQGILSPMEYKKSKGERFSTGFTPAVKEGWSSVAVKRILTNEIYTGTMVQGRREKISYKLDKCRDKPREEWNRVEGTHEAVVTKEEFDSVQKFLSIDSRASGVRKRAHLFCGLLFCGDCGEPMIRRVNRYKGVEKVYFICPARNRGMGCTRHSIWEEDLKQAVLKGLRTQADLLTNRENILCRMEKTAVDRGRLFQTAGEIARLREEEEKYISLERGLWEDLREGVVSPKDFHDFREIYEEQTARIREVIRKQKQMMQTLYQSGLACEKRLEGFRERPELTELNRDALICFVNRILVYEGKRLCLEWKFRGQFSRTVMPGGDV